MLFLCSFHVKHPKHYQSQEIREPFKKYLTENHFAKKPLAEMGGIPPPPLTQVAKLFREMFSLKG